MLPSSPSRSLPSAHAAPHPPLCRGSTKRGVAAPSFSPVPPDRLKLQSVASPSVGTLIRGRLHCSGTLLAALGYQLFPYCLWPSVFPTLPLPLPSCFLSPPFYYPPLPSYLGPCFLFVVLPSFLPSFLSSFFLFSLSLSLSLFLLFSSLSFLVLLSGRISVFMGVRSAS